MMNNIYRDLQIHLDKLPIGYPATKSGVEIRILKHLFNEEEAILALCLTLAKSSVAKVKTRLKKQFSLDMSREDIKKKLDIMFMNGTIDRSDNKDSHVYSNAMLVIGMFEFQVDALTKEFMEMLHQYLDEGFDEEFFSSALPQLRTSPHLKAVIPEHQIAIYDNMKEFIQNTKEDIHVANCVCKQGSDLLGNPCKQVDNLEICLIVGGKSYVEREKARKISKEECLELLDYAEEKGLVIQPGNTYEPFCICLCCGCCCGVITTAKTFPKPAQLFASNYFAEIESEKCVGCGICLKRCQIDAITIENKKAIMNLDRCIGCGLCVTKCPTKAISLIKKDKEIVPPKNIVSLYLTILKNKVGKKKMMLNMLKLLLGRQM